MNNINLSIVTPYGLVFTGEVKSLTVPGAEGEMGILPFHCDILSLLDPGVIYVEFPDGRKELIAINWGCLEVNGLEANILANGAVAIQGESPGQIQEALQSAKLLLEEATKDVVAISAVISKMENSVKAHN